MDPITAIGFAASILTFVEFSCNLVTGTYEVLRSTSGTTAENTDIGNVIDDLHAVTAALKLHQLGQSEHEKALQKLASKCSNLSKELLGLLENLKVKGKNSAWKSLKAKLESVRNEKGISSMETRLNRYRSQILIRLNLMLG